MPYFLKYYFDVNQENKKLRPQVDLEGNADCYNLGYVENVIKGQLLAELVPLSPDMKVNQHSAHLYDEMILPQGPNTCVDPEHPHYLIATANGYPFYHNGTVQVKKTLEIPSNVDFHIGNIFFVGDTIVHGTVRAGFEVESNNVIIHKNVEGAVIRARRNMHVMEGVRGGAGGHCLLAAGKNLRISFAEKAELRAGKNMLVMGSTLHSDMYVGNNLFVRQRVMGGTIQCQNTIYVGGNVGNSAFIPTHLYLGYNPAELRKLEQVERAITQFAEKIRNYENQLRHKTEEKDLLERKLTMSCERRDHLQTYRNQLWKTIRSVDDTIGSRLVIKGTVYPGVEIAIGQALMSIKEESRNVCFTLQGQEVIMRSAERIDERVLIPEADA